MPLSYYLSKENKIDFIALDIEGVENKVLEDLERHKILKRVEKMFVEYHQQIGNSLSEVTGILEKNGFKLLTYGGVRPPFKHYENKFYSIFIWAYR